jgi:hypothetical protein
MTSFAFRRFLPDRVFEQLTDLRIDEPALAAERIRTRRRVWELPRPLVVLAADHPARRVTRVGDDPARLGNRHEYLARIARALSGSDAHGVMATADILEELALLDHLAAERGGGFLDGKLLIGSVNRGGLDGLEHELFDPPTAFRDLEVVADLGLDGVKYLVRVPERDDHDRDAIATLAAVAESIDQARRLGLRIFLEPLAVRRREDRGPDSGWEIVTDADAMIRVVSVAAGLSSSSSGVWLKLPAGPEFDRVARSCTHPILLLGGPAGPEPLQVVADFLRAAREAPNVRGALVGRTLLYPGDNDPAAATQALVKGLETSDLAAAEAALHTAATDVDERSPF